VSDPITSFASERLWPIAPFARAPSRGAARHRSRSLARTTYRLRARRSLATHAFVFAFAALASCGRSTSTSEPNALDHGAALHTVAGSTRADALTGGDASASSHAAAAVDASTLVKPARRASGAALTRLRQAIDRGRVDDAEARAVLADESVPAAERLLLRARISALSGHDTDAMREIEDARKLAPDDPCVYATAAEIYAGLSQSSLALQEVFRGEKQCGASSELVRAKGILAIGRQGHAVNGLALLEQALAADPKIPFIDRALGQAHLLVAKERTKANDLAGALEHARASLAHDPDEIDAHRFLAETLSARQEWEAAAAELQSLVDRGERLEAELALTYKNAAVAAVLRGDRERALDHFAAARKLGLTDAELGFGAEQLAIEAQKRLEAGVEAYKAKDLATAERELRRALDLEPNQIQAQNHLAVVLFKQRNYTEAVHLWQRVIATARAEKIDLPEPVHLNLAKAQVQEGDREGAALTLEEYLDRQPSGEWAAPTREMLASLPAPSHPR
jgi:tetratricopeptide (TPR) repeat protein